MGRGTAQEVLELKAHIVRQSTRLFAEHGFGATSVRDIASASGVSKALVLYHFGSKNGLRDRVMSDLAAAWDDLLPRVRDAAAAGDDVVRRVFVEAVETSRKYPDLTRLLMRQMLSDDPSLRQVLTDRAMPVLTTLEDALRDSPRVRVPADFDMRAALVFFALALLSVVTVFPPPGESVDDDRALLGVRVLEQGLRSLGLTLEPVSTASR